jgi:tetratricopeptide (TPR) repeat protein
MRYVLAVALAAFSSCALAQYVQPSNYAQLRADCADDSDVARQIAGCEAVLANPAEQNNYAIAINNRGHARERSGDLAAALADYERAVAIDPGYGDAHLNRGSVLARLGRAEDALSAFDRSIAIADGVWARLERGRLLARRNERDRALADFEAAVRFLPSDQELLSERDWARVREVNGFDFAELSPPPTTLAEAVLSAEGFSGLLFAEDASRLRREGPNRVRLESATMPHTGGPGRYEVEARTCSEVIYTEIAEQPGGPHVDRRIIDLDRLRALLSRQGDDLVYAEGAYGQRTLQTARGPVTVAMNTRPGRQPVTEHWYSQALAYLDAIRRFCPGSGPAPTEVAQVQPAPAAPPPVGPRDPLEAAVIGAPARPYVGDALFRAPLGPLPSADALLAYTRDLLAPAFPGLTLSAMSASNPLALRGEAPSLPQLTLRWWDLQGAGTAQLQMSAFERELNGGCVNHGIMGQRGGDGARVILYSASCPQTNPPYQLGWLVAFDRERSRLLLVATPSANGAAMQAAGQRMLAALGMAGETTAPSAPPRATAPPVAAAPSARAPERPAPQPAPAGPDLGALAENFLADYILGGAMTPEQRRSVTRPRPNVARFEQPPIGNQAGIASEVEARSCSEVVWRDRHWDSRRRVDLETVYDLPAMARITIREGENIRQLPGPYGRRVDYASGGVTSQMSQAEQLLRPSVADHGDADRLLRLIEHFCTERRAAAPVAPPPGSARATGPVASASEELDAGLAAHQAGDFDTAQRRFRGAAELGDAQAMYNMGAMSLLGQGRAADSAEAARWFRQAADRGHLGAQNHLGVLYENGDGVTRSREEAIRWFRLAAVHGHEEARRNFEIIASSRGVAAPASAGPAPRIVPRQELAGVPPALLGNWGADCARPNVGFTGSSIRRLDIQREFPAQRSFVQGRIVEVEYEASGAIRETFWIEGDGIRWLGRTSPLGAADQRNPPLWHRCG